MEYRPHLLEVMKIGQYFVICNMDREEMIEPHKFGDGSKLMEFGMSADGTMTGLAVLLRKSQGGGGGDIRSERDVVGSWAGDRIAIPGDYGEVGDMLPDKPEGLAKRLKGSDVNLYQYARAEFEDVSDEVIKAIVDPEGERSVLSQLTLDSNESRGIQRFDAHSKQ